MSILVGIDLGTTNSAVASLKDGKALILAGPDGKVLVPSIVYLGQDGELLVGEPAREKALLDPERAVTHVKRQMGTDWSVTWQDKEFSAPMISSFILRELKTRAEKALGTEVTSAIITVPAYFNDLQRKATKEAGELAGLKVLRLINEPTAATLAYGLGGNEGKVLAFDLGGGTFDVSVLVIEDGVYEVLATRGINQLGGRDFDQEIIEFLLHRYREQHTDDPMGDPLARAKFNKAAEQAKESLSNFSNATIDLPFISAGPSGPIHFKTEMSRVEFETLLQPHLERMMESVAEALRDADLGVDEIDSVVLIGGSTRIPMIRDALNKQFHGRVRTDMNPEECVALGAAAQAGVMQGQLTGLVLVDVTPLSLGIETEHDVFVPIIPRNTPLPARAHRLFTTISDFQEMVEVKVLQGERLRASKNIPLGDMTLKGLSAGRAGEVRIEVTFEIDVNGLVKVFATDQRSGVTETTQIVAARTLSAEEIASCVEAGQQTRNQDEQYLLEIKTKQQSQELIRQARHNLGARPNLNPQMKKEIQAAISDLEEALEKGEGSAAMIQTHLKNLIESLDQL